MRRVVVTVADRVGEPDGLWPADFDLLTRLPGLGALDLVCSEAALAAGFLERLHAALPELEDVRAPHVPRPPRPSSCRLVAATGGATPIAFTYRDREEELAAVARRLKAEQRAGRRRRCTAPRSSSSARCRISISHATCSPTRRLRSRHSTRCRWRPSPTRPLSISSSTPSQRLHARVAPGPASIATLLLDGRGASRLRHASLDAAIAACDVALADARYLGGLDRLEALVARWSAIDAPPRATNGGSRHAAPAAAAMLTRRGALAPLAQERPAIEQIATLMAWLAIRLRRPSGRTRPARGAFA